MKNQLIDIQNNAGKELENCSNSETLENIRIKYLGKKGSLTKLLKEMANVSKEDKPIIGKLANQVRNNIEDKIKEATLKIKKVQLTNRLEQEELDVTIPGKKFQIGKMHPLNRVLEEIENIFIGMGFSIADGPEIENEYYNFDALNIPKNHPARDTQDTFYIDENHVLRTQTSPVQIRIMQSQKPPIRIISPGRVYRSDSVDATHSPIFHQIEGLAIDKNIKMSDLKGTLETFIKKLYGESVKIRLRPHHFPFTEPSAEIDVMCFSCKGSGCKICKNEGFIEILGAGMVHPNVLSQCGIDHNIYSGFAFGMGLERIVMRMFGIDDIRLFFENDIQFLNNI